MSDTQGHGVSVYLSGEIHSDWREQVEKACQDKGFNFCFCSPVTDHDASDHCGVRILGEEEKAFWKDRLASGINRLRTSSRLKASQVAIIRFGPKYKQWNAAFDAGIAAALNIPYITLHDEELDHALKEIDEQACATARTPEQVVEILAYAFGS